MVRAVHHEIAAILPYAGILGLMFMFLSFDVVRYRWKYKVLFGDEGYPELARAIRIHGNFAEYVPLALLLLLLLSLSEVSPWVIHIMGTTLILARILHYFGVKSPIWPNLCRFFGVTLTWIVMIMASILCIVR